MTNNIYIEGIGKVKITKKKGVKRITLSVSETGNVRITIPYPVSFKDAEQFINEKKDWIIRSRKKMKSKKRNTLFTPQTVFNTKKHRLLFIPGNKTYIIVTDSYIKVYYDKSIKFEDEKFQNYIRTGITETLRSEAREYLPERTKYLAEIHNFNYGKVTVRNAKTRWGSCSGKNNISLNIHLMRLPEHLSDYVILHELCHTIEKNHGKNFWMLLDKVSGNAKKLDSELKKFSPNIF
ncbi:MAG: M48 family metallopeptidase [Chlorobi bacterium]|nr:M48 family metallopeptidase [Chlorobiota bacterium]